jgi:hypothetical protein
MPLERIKVRSFRQKFQHGEVAAVIVPVMAHSTEWAQWIKGNAN